MLPLNEHHAAWIGRTLTDASGYKIGKVEDIYTDDDTGQPEWLAVTTGLLGPGTHFVPLRGATANGRGVQVPFPKDRVKVAPSACGDGRLSRLEKGRLYAHYGYSYAEERNRLQRALGFDPPAPSRPAEGRDVGRAVELWGVIGAVDVRTETPPADRHDEAQRLPPAGRSEGRGRWPDDEAIFGLAQQAAHPALAANGPSRRA